MGSGHVHTAEREIIRERERERERRGGTVLPMLRTTLTNSHVTTESFYKPSLATKSRAVQQEGGKDLFL